MMPPTTLPVAPTRSRLVHVDTLRVILTFLVVAHHAAITYSSIPVWYYYEPRGDASAGLLDVFVVVNQLWFMGCFFLLSGLFVPRSYDRKGARRFTRDRLLRLGVPLVAFVILIRPLAMLPGMFEQRAAAIADGREFSLITWYFTEGDPGPMWFVEVLLFFTLCYVGIRLITGNREPRPAPTTLRLSWLAGLVAVLTVLTYLWRIVVPTETYWPTVGLPTPAYLPQYALLFTVGVLAGRHGWLASLRAKHGWVGLGMVLTGAVVAVASAVGGLDQVAGNGTPASAGLAAAEALIAVGMTLLLLVVLRRFVSDAPGRFHQFLSTHAFSVYIIHPVILVGVAILLIPVQGVAVAKFALLFLIAVPICWALAHLLKRLPGADRVL